MQLNWRDIAKGFLVAFIAFALNYAQETLIPSLDISPELKTGLVMLLAYLAKNFFTKPPLK